MAPIFVGSNNENTRIRSNRIGFAASTSDPGSAAEGDGYYNSSDNQLKFYAVRLVDLCDKTTAVP